MRVIYIPNSTEEWIGILIALLIVLAVAGVIFLWNKISPPLLTRLVADERYQHAMGIYTDKIGNITESTREQRWAAFDAARDYLVGVRGIPLAEADKNLGVMVAAYDKDLSYGLRGE